jgi:S-adenosylmethionine hydrolase
MIGVVKSICPTAEVISIANDVPPHDVVRGAWALYQAVGFFPSGTIHVAVVDPGVGTDRRGLLVDTGREVLIGPDNGILSWAFRNRPEATFRSLANPAYRLSSIGVTFDGRDLFAPVAAHLANGVDPGDMGPLLSEPVKLGWAEPRIVPGRIEGEILVEDRFGNLISSIPFVQIAAEFADKPLAISLGGRLIGGLSGAYEMITDPVGAVVNGAGMLEIAAHSRSAAQITGKGRGTKVVVTAKGDP